MKQLEPIEYKSQRILTTAQIAEAYGTDTHHIHDNYRKNKERYTEGKHYYHLQGKDLTQFRNLYPEIFRSQNTSKVRSLYLWTEKGAFLHAKSLGTDQAWEVYQTLVDEYYRLVKQSASRPIHTLTDALRERALLNLKQVPEGFFSVMGELFKHLYNLEAILNQNLDNKAQLEISVGMHWSKYARDVLHIPDGSRRTYKHHYQDGRMVDAYAYPILSLGTFDKWLWFDYIPEHFPGYVKYRARYMASIKQLASTPKQSQRELPHIVQMAFI